MDVPPVGGRPSYSLAADEVPWVLGTQLSMDHGPLGRAEPGSTVLLVEARAFAARKPFHAQKLTLLFSAMRHFRDRLEAAGYDVEYRQAETFQEALSAFFAAHPDRTLVTMASPSWGSADRLRELAAAAGGSVRVVENDLFLSSPAAVEEWTGEDRQLRHEQFYRWMRRETGVLMDGEGPVGGEWNYDDRNREFPPADWDAPPRLTHEPDALTERTAVWVEETFDTWGEPEPFEWPVTRDGALAQLEHFLEHRLPEFGPYQDAMRNDDWAMAHALLSPALNLGLLRPGEVVAGAVEAYRGREAVSLASVEGFVRQVLGWREFVRHAYRRGMPDLADANQLGADRPLPEWYWTGETDMACLAGAIEDVRSRGYAHHIQRLMVLANAATLWGVNPAALNDWFHATFVDAYHWVTTPNVVEMGAYGDGLFATKPYVASANYVDRMSDYCEGCQYDPDATTGDGACPLNALYWAFLARNEDQLRSNHRMGLMYGHLDDKREAGDLAEIQARVEELRALDARGEL